MLIPPHLPGSLTRRERFDRIVADAAGALIERYPRRLQHLRVLVEDVPPSDPAPWEDRAVALGRALPATREHPPRIVVHRMPIQSRAAGPEDVEMIVRQVVSEQIGSMLGIAPEDLDPEAWEG